MALVALHEMLFHCCVHALQRLLELLGAVDLVKFEVAVAEQQVFIIAAELAIFYNTLPFAAAHHVEERVHGVAQVEQPTQTGIEGDDRVFLVDFDE